MIERSLKNDVKTWRIANLRGWIRLVNTPHFDPNAVKEDTEEPFWY